MTRHASVTWPEHRASARREHEGRCRAEHADRGRPAGRRGARTSTWRWATSPSRSASTRSWRSSTTSPATPCRPRRPSSLSLLRRPHEARQLGTAVIVLPWHDPVRVAEQIALLDIMSRRSVPVRLRPRRRERRVRGLPHPDGARRGRASSRPRRSWSRRSARRSFEWDGEFFQIPRTSIRPRPISHPERRFYACVGEPGIGRDHGQARLRHARHHAERVAEGREDIQRYQAMRAERAGTRRGRRSS